MNKPKPQLKKESVNKKLIYNYYYLLLTLTFIITIVNF